MNLPARAALLIAVLMATGHAEPEENPAEELAVSASGDLRVLARRGQPDEHSDGRLSVWVESGGKRADLPPSPVALKGNGEGDTWGLLIPPDVGMSPDGRWLFATQKVCTGYCIGYLYRRGSGLDFRIATKTRFDGLAWRFFAKTEDVNVEELIASDSPAHLIDFVLFSDRYLGFALRGAVGNVPPEKNVARDPYNTRGETGIYDWQCLYDLKEGTFVIPEEMKAHNRGAWKRWIGDSELWDKDTEHELETTLRALTATLDAPAQKKLRKEQQTWQKAREAKKNDPNFDSFDITRERAVELLLRVQKNRVLDNQ